MNNLTVEEHQSVRYAKANGDELLIDIIERLDRELTAKIEHCKRVEDAMTALENQNEDLQGKLDREDDGPEYEGRV